MPCNAGREAPAGAAFNPDPQDIDIPSEQQWRAFYKLALEGGQGSEVGLGRTATAWRTIDVPFTNQYLSRLMTNPKPDGTVIHGGDVEMEPVKGGPSDLPTTYWTFNGLAPIDLDYLNPTYSISMGHTAQVHFLQECFETNKFRVWGAFVEDVEIDLLGEFVELFPYAEFIREDCAVYEVEPFEGPTKKVYAYCPPGRVVDPTPSVPITEMAPGQSQWQKLFNE